MLIPDDKLYLCTPFFSPLQSEGHPLALKYLHRIDNNAELLKHPAHSYVPVPFLGVVKIRFEDLFSNIFPRQIEVVTTHHLLLAIILSSAKKSLTTRRVTEETFGRRDA